MIRKSGFAIVLFLLASAPLVFTGCTSRAPAPGTAVEEFAAHLDRRVPELLARFDVPGVSMALIQDGQLVWSGAYGYADVARERPMTAETMARAESISKSVTAWGVMRLVEAGQIELDAPLSRYVDVELPASPYDTEEITVRRLLSNSAGLPQGTVGPAAEYAPQGPLPAVDEYLTKEGQPIQEPGAGFVYSNVGFNLLEVLVEEVTGRPYAAYMAEEVLQPVGMDEATFAWNEQIDARLAVGYEQDGTPVPTYVYALSASGGLFADVEDLGRFVQAEMTGPFNSAEGVLTPESVSALQTPQVPIPGLFGFVAEAYGFGHFIETLPDGRRAVWHGGQGHGWMTHFHAVPEAGDGIVVVTNSQRSWPFMAHLLSDWARWSGFESVKFGRIVAATRAVWILIGVLAALVLGQGVRLVRDVRGGRRRLAPLAPESSGTRLLQGILAVAIVAALGWSTLQPYLFVSSIFPVAAGWGAGVLLALALALAASALLARR